MKKKHEIPLHRKQKSHYTERNEKNGHKIPFYRKQKSHYTERNEKRVIKFRYSESKNPIKPKEMKQ